MIAETCGPSHWAISGEPEGVVTAETLAGITLL